MTTKTIVDNLHKKLDTARAEYKPSRIKFESIERYVLEQNKKLLEEFMRVKNKELEDEHEKSCDCGRSLWWKEAFFTADGITLATEADHPYDIRHEDYGWVEVDKVLGGFITTLNLQVA